MVAVVSLLTVAHLVEIGMWATTMTLTGAVASGDGLYFAFTTYTTIGYGDIVAQRPWRLLGPISGKNGVLLFGWSTTVIFQTLHNTASGAGRRMGAARTPAAPDCLFVSMDPGSGGGGRRSP